jgi:hypothetical protein
VPIENDAIVIIAAHQRLTKQWWKGRSAYRLFISQMVRDEAALGDPSARTRRLRAIRGIPALAITDEATRVAGELVRRGALPRRGHGRRIPHRRRCSPDRVPVDLELQAHRQCHDAWYD